MSDIADKVHNKDEEIEDDDESSENDAGAEVDSDEYDDNEYCICRGRDDGTFMIQCDRCTEWYHGKCIQVTRRKVKEVERWVCPFCEAKIKAGITPTPVTHHPKRNGTQKSARKTQDQSRGDDDKPRKRKRDEESTSGPEVKRAKSEHKSEHKSDTNNTKSSETKHLEPKSESKENALKTSREGRTALKKSDKSATSSPPPLRHSAGTSEAQWLQQREGVRSKLVAMLQRVSTEAALPDIDSSDTRLQEIAREIEDTLAEHVPRPQYLSKFRALMLSLPKNSELCGDVLRGAVSGSALVRMDEEQWAPKALQDLRAKYQHYLPVKPTDDDTTPSTAGTVPPSSTAPESVPSVTRDSDARKKSDSEHVTGEEKSGDERSESVHDELSRDAVSRDSSVQTSEHRNHVTDTAPQQQTPPGSPYQPLDDSDSEHVTGPNIALADIEIDVKVDERSLEPIEFTELAPEPVPEHTPAPEPQSGELYDPDASMEDEDEALVTDEHVTPSEYIDQSWRGLLTYQKLIPDVALRSVHLEGAKVEHLIGEELVIDGRMELHKLLDYLPQIDLSKSRQRTTLLFKPEVGYDEYYHRMYEHLTSLNRGGVIRVDEHAFNTELFKEVYLVPVLRHSPPPFIQSALRALVESPQHRHLIGQSEELLLGVFLTRRTDLAALPARVPRTPKQSAVPVPEVSAPPPQSHTAKSHAAPESKSAPTTARTPAVQTPNLVPGMSLPPNPNPTPNPTTFLPPQLQSLLSNLIGQALVPPVSGTAPTPPYNPNPAQYVPPQQTRGYPPQSYSAPYSGMNNSAAGQYDDYRHQDYRGDYQDEYQGNEYHHSNHNEYQHDAEYQGQHSNNTGGQYTSGDYQDEYQDQHYRGGYHNNNRPFNSNNRFRGHYNNNNSNYHNNNNRRGGGGFRSGGGGGGRFRSNQRGRRY